MQRFSLREFKEDYGNHDKCFLFAGRTPEKQKEIEDRYLTDGWNEIHQSLDVRLSDGTLVGLSHLPYVPPKDSDYDVRYLEYRPEDRGFIFRNYNIYFCVSPLSLAF